MRGVHRVRDKWEATIGRYRSPRFINLGRFDRFEDAVAARKCAEIARFGYEHDSESPIIDNDLAHIPVFDRTGKRVCYATVDLEDLNKVGNKRWCFCNGYATRRIANKNVKMHMCITDIQSPDHVDRNKMNNSKKNLRQATTSQNNCNSNLRSHNKSGFKGVCWCKVRSKWRVTLKTKTKHIHVGYFEDVQVAASAYDNLAIQIHGEFAATNKALGLL